MSRKQATKAVAYARRSTDMQERSIPDQKAYVERWAQENGYRIERWYVDDAISGTSTKGRVAFERMIKDAEGGGGFAAVLCYDISRFSRGGTNETGFYLHRLHVAGVDAIFCAEGIPEGEEGELLQGVKSWQARQYSVKLSRDCIRGTISHIMQKKCAPGGKAPYGFDKQHCTAAGQVLRTFRWLPDGRKQEFGGDGKLIRVLEPGESVKKAKSDTVRFVHGDPAHIKIVRRIFDRCIEGYGYHHIANRLNEEGIPGVDGGHWQSSTISRVLANPTYRGAIAWNRRTLGKINGVAGDGTLRPKRGGDGHYNNHEDDWFVVEDAHEPIVSPAVFKKARRAVESRRDLGGLAKPTNRSLLSGLIICLSCGHRFLQKKTNSTSGGRSVQYRYYTDGGYNRGGKTVCRISNIPADALDAFVVGHVRDILLGDHEGVGAAIDRFVEAAMSRHDDGGVADARAVEKDLAAVDRRIKVTIGMLADPAFDGLDELKVTLAGLKKRRDGLRSQLDRGQRKPDAPFSERDLRAWADDRFARLDDLDLSKGATPEARRLVQAYVERIEIDPHERRGTLVLPADALACLERDICTRGAHGELIAAGKFTNSITGTVNNIAQWNGTTWQPLLSGIQLPAFGDSGVYALHAIGFDLYVGGTFTSAGGVANTLNLARWNGSLWSSMGNAGVASSAVFALSFYIDSLYVGGNFTAAGGVAANNIARRTGTTWSALGSGVAGSVFAISHYNFETYVGGNFTFADGNAAPYIARWNGFSWAGVGSGMNAHVSTLMNWNGELWAGGLFTNAGGVTAFHIARWNGSAWSFMSAFPGITSVVLSLAQNFGDGEIAAGGIFDSNNDGLANNITRWDGTRWNSFGGATCTSVNTLLNFGNRLLVAGSMYQFDYRGKPIYNIALWDGLRLKSLGFTNAAEYLDLDAADVGSGNLEIIAARAGSPYVHRTTVDPNLPDPAPIWASMGPTTGSLSVSGAVRAVERYNGVVHIGGDFNPSHPAWQVKNYFARWDAVLNRFVTVSGGTDGPVHALKTFNGSLHVGGQFQNVGVSGATHAPGVAKWNGTTWSALDTTVSGTFYAMEVYAGRLILGGVFVGVTNSPNIAAYNGTSIVSVGPFGNGGANGAVRTLKTIGNKLYVGGDFTMIDGVAANRLAVWNGTSWTGLNGGGADGQVRALADYADALHVGGSFLNVGTNTPSRHWAFYQLGGVPWFVDQPQSGAVACHGSFATSAQAAAGYYGTYQWRRSGASLVGGPSGTGSSYSGVNSANFTISNVSDADEGNYDCVMTNLCGSGMSTAATLTVTGVCEPCYGEMTGDGIVDVFDLFILLGNWGTNGPGAGMAAPYDVIDVFDLFALLGGWGNC